MTSKMRSPYVGQTFAVPCDSGRYVDWGEYRIVAVTTSRVRYVHEKGPDSLWLPGRHADPAAPRTMMRARLSRFLPKEKKE